MATDTVTIGIDIGTSGVRAVALAPDLTVIAQGQAALAAEIRREPESWWQATEQALDRLLGKVAPGRVAALAVDGTSGTLLVTDEAGQPLAPALLYNDPVEDRAVLERIAGLAPATSAAHGKTSGLAKLIVLGQISGAVHGLHQADWIAGRLTGRFDLSDENNALKTGYDPVTRQWPDWLKESGAKTRLLPRVLEPGAVMGTVGPAAVARFGFSTATRVVAGTTDGCASFLATGASRLGDGVTALGTTLVIKTLSGTPLFAPDFGLYSHRLGRLWLAGGASNSGGGVIAAHFTPERIAELTGRLNPDIPTGLNYYPLLRPGERFPVNNPTLPPRLTPRPVDDGVFFQGILEGIAGIEEQAYRLLADLGAPPLVSVRTVGGGARNVAWGHLRAARLGVPILPARSEDAAAGTAGLAWRGVIPTALKDDPLVPPLRAWP